MAERKGKKLRRCTAKSRAYYAVQVSTSETNKKKKLRKHIRNNPMDAQAFTRYEKDMGKAEGLGLTPKGVKLLKRATAHEVANRLE